MKSIDSEIEKFEQELRDMDENLLVYGHRIKAMQSYIAKQREKK